MPIDNIERAIKRAAGGTEGANLIEATYEGYGPGGVAILIETLGDNRNRAISEIRNVLSRGGGNLGESGCVTWIFEPKGVITVTAGDADEEELTEEKGKSFLRKKLSALRMRRRLIQHRALLLANIMLAHRS